MSAFKLGDVVRLKSGGPAMTVCEVSHGEVKCSWFVGNDTSGWSFDLFDAFFAPDALDLLAK